MTEFTDIFSQELEKRGESLEDNLQEFDRRQSYRQIKKQISERFVEVKYGKIDSPDVIAADAGRNSISLRNNQHFYVTQASAVDSENNNSRSLKTGIARPFNSRSFSRLMSYSSELSELEALNERLEEFEHTDKTFILIDGSLLTRMMPMPRQLEVSSDSEIVLDLIDEFHSLLEKVVSRKELILAGISKDSNSSLLNRAVIEKISGKTLKEMDEEESELAEIHRQSVPDTALMDWEKSGYTQPVLVGAASREFRSRIDSFRSEPSDYVKENFEDQERAKRTLEKVGDYPGLASFYWQPGDDQPVRVDLLGHRWSEKDLIEVEDRNFVEEKEVMKEVIQVLETGYAGRERHNIWISMADSQASLSTGEMENVYMPIMSQRLELNLREYRRRRDRRV